ncbi:hypothetical protein P9112_003113 [Eukaryota sp. TZLM1-RC]
MKSLYKSLLFIGLSNAGKTTLVGSLLSLFNGHHISSTIQSNYLNIHHCRKGAFHYFLIDLNGNVGNRHLWKHHLEDGVDVIVFVVDSADTDTIEEATTELHYLLPLCSNTNIFIVANKQDKPGAITREEVLQRLYHTSMSQVKDVKVVDSVATSGFNVCELMKLVRDLSWC